MNPNAMDFRAVVDYVALPAAAIEQLMGAGGFPRPQPVPGCRLAWLTREVDAWCETQPIPLPDETVPISFDEWEAAARTFGR